MDRTENLNKNDVTEYALTFANLGKIGTGMTTRGGVELQFLLNPVSSKEHVPSGTDMTVKLSSAVVGVG